MRHGLQSTWLLGSMHGLTDWCMEHARLQVKVLMVELDGTSKEKDAAVVELLERAAFAAVQRTGTDDIISINTVFVHQTAWPHLRAAPGVRWLGPTQ